MAAPTRYTFKFFLFASSVGTHGCHEKTYVSWSFSAFRVKFQALSWTAKPEILKQIATGALTGIGTCKDMWGNLGMDRDGYVYIYIYT